VDNKGQENAATPAATTATAAAASPDAEARRRVIKRYSNRKLYDTKDSRYVTLLQIAEMVRGGEEVQIIDNNTKEDLTEVTLAQIIYEEQKQKASSSRNVPLQTLKDLIHQRTEKVLSDLREGPIGRLIPGSGKSEPPGPLGEAKADESASSTAQKPTNNGSTPPAASGSGSVATVGSKPNLIEQAKETWEDWQTKIDERVKAVVPNLLPWQQLQTEIKRLNARIEDLEAQVKTLGGQPTKPEEPKQPE